MGVIKLKDRWAIDYYENGQRVRKVIGDGHSKTLATQALHSVKTKLAEDQYLPGKKRDDAKISDIIKTYWDDYLKHQKSGKSTWYSLMEAEKAFGHLPIANLRKNIIEGYKRKAANRIIKKNGERVKPASVNRTIQALSAAIGYAMKTELIRIDKNPCSDVALLPENNVRDIVLSEEQYTSFYQCLAPHIKPIVAFAYYTGCRRGEILNLKKTDVDFSRNVAHIRDTKNSENRYVPIDSRLKEILVPLIAECSESEYLFNYKQKRIRGINKGFTAACRRARISDLHFHDLRHTALTNWAKQGHSHFLIMQASGHKTVSCFKRYLSFKNNDLQKLVA